MRTFIRVPLNDLIHPAQTRAVLYPYDKPTNSILLRDNSETGLTGYVFVDPTGNQVIKENTLADFSVKTNIVIGEKNPFCPEITQAVPTEEDPQTEWKYIFILRNFRAPKATEIRPDDFRWYHQNSIPWSRIHCPAEREILKEYIRSQ